MKLKKTKRYQSHLTEKMNKIGGQPKNWEPSSENVLKFEAKNGQCLF